MQNNDNIVDLLSTGECIKLDINLISDVKSISFDLKPNKNYEDSFIVYNDRELVFSGIVYIDNTKIKLLNNKINGKNVKISFIIDTQGLEDGDKIAGNFAIITDIGYLSIPYSYNIVLDNVKKAINNLNTIEDFYKLTLEDKDFAKTVFLDDRFTTAHFMNDKFALTIYQGLNQSVNKNIALIEFFYAFNLDVKDVISKDSDALLEYYSKDHIYDANNMYSENLDIDNLNTIYNEIDNNTQNVIDILNRIQDKELIDILAVICVRNNKTDIISFNVYTKTIENGTSITGLFEKLLISIPKDYDKTLPLYVYKLYYEDKNYSFEQKLNLYSNIINVFDEYDDVYKMYNDEIVEYTLAEIYQNKLSESLAKIYNKVLKIDIINENNNKNILYLLRSHKVVVKNSKIKKIIIKYRETTTETKYDVINHIAYVPIFFDTYIMLFEDVYGNRYYNQDIEIKRLFERQDLENYCLDKYPDENIINVTKILNFLDNNKFSNDIDVDSAKRYIIKMRLNNIVINNLQSMIIDFYYNKVINENKLLIKEIDFFKSLILNTLNDFDKKKVVKALLNIEEYLYVYNLILKYNTNLLSDEDLEVLYEHLIKTNANVDKEYLNINILNLINTKADSIFLIDYLIENYNGSIENEIFILNAAKELSINTFVLSKRLLNTMLSLNYNENIDFVFSTYDYKKDVDEKLNYAYLTKKCTNFFLDDEPISEEVINNLIYFLVQNLNNLENQPLIYILSFTKFFASIDTIKDSDIRRVLLRAVDFLIKKDLVFAYFKKLNRHVRMPLNIMNKAYIEYHTKNDFLPKATYVINGIGEEKEIDLIKVYKNIYVRRITVFKNEVLSYKIYNSTNLDEGVLYSGEIPYDINYEFEHRGYNKSNDTFDYINLAIQYLEQNNFNSIKRLFIDMTTRQEVLKTIFIVNDKTEGA